MPSYIQRGEIPAKRHTQFRRPDGELYTEQLFSTEGFSNDSSLLYHKNPPTAIMSIDKPVSMTPQAADENELKHRSFEGFKIDPLPDYLESRKTILFNNDVHISLAAPEQSLKNYFYKNADADELIFVHEGDGVLITAYGEISFNYGDYLVIPRGTIYQIHFKNSSNRLLITESFSPSAFRINI